MAHRNLSVLAKPGILLGGGAAHGGRVPGVALANTADYHWHALPPHLLEQPAQQTPHAEAEPNVPQHIKDVLSIQRFKYDLPSIP